MSLLLVQLVPLSPGVVAGKSNTALIPNLLNPFQRSININLIRGIGGALDKNDALEIAPKEDRVARGTKMAASLCCVSIREGK